MWTSHGKHLYENGTIQRIKGKRCQAKLSSIKKKDKKQKAGNVLSVGPPIRQQRWEEDSQAKLKPWIAQRINDAGTPLQLAGPVHHVRIPRPSIRESLPIHELGSGHLVPPRPGTRRKKLPRRGAMFASRNVPLSLSLYLSRARAVAPLNDDWTWCLPPNPLHTPCRSNKPKSLALSCLLLCPFLPFANHV